MFKRLLHWRIRAFEQRYDYDAAYMHEIADIDLHGLLKFQRLVGVGQHHGGLPTAALFAAKLAAAMHEDCGPCAQIVINMAREAGVDAATLTALAAHDFDNLAPATALAFRFAQAVLRHDAAVETLRPAVLETFGPRGPWCLALALSVGRTFPVLKRAMGHARACAQLEIDGQAVAVAH